MGALTRVIRGFSLIEVVIALALLSLSLMVVLETAGLGYGYAGRTNDLSLMALLARQKMVQIEAQYFRQGFSLDAVEEEGNFDEEGHEEVHWKSRIFPIEMQLDALQPLCDGLSGDKKAASSTSTAEGGNDCSRILAQITQVGGGFISEIARSIRVVDLSISMPRSPYAPSRRIRALITRDDFSTLQASEAAQQQQQLENLQNQGQTEQPTATPQPQSPPPSPSP